MVSSPYLSYITFGKYMSLSPLTGITICARVPYSKEFTYLVKGLNISPHLGGDVGKVMVAADVFSDLPEARDTVGLAKISNMMKDYIPYSFTNMVCTGIRKPIKNN